MQLLSPDAKMCRSATRKKTFLSVTNHKLMTLVINYHSVVLATSECKINKFYSLKHVMFDQFSCII